MNKYIKHLIEHYIQQSEYKYNENIKLLIESYFDLEKRTYTKYPDTYILDENMENEDSELDKELKGEESNIGSFIRQNTPIIYAFVTNMMKPAVKIGFTTQGALKRLQQWQKYFPDAELIGYWTAVEFIEDAEKKTKTKVFFQDFPVHKETVKKGFANLTREEFDKEFDSLAQEDFSFDLSTLTRHYSKEFFKKENLEKRLLTKEVVEEIVLTVKDKIKAGDRTDIQTYGIDTFEKQRSGGKPLAIQHFPKTGLQEEAIKNGLEAIKNNKTHLLLGAVMRFGKTFTAYEIVSQSHLKKVIVTSAIADTRESWRNDIYHTDFMDKDNFVFMEFNNQKSQGFYLVTNKKEYCKEYNYTPTFIEDYLKENDCTVIFFTTLQDLSGTLIKNTGGHKIKTRHSEIFNIEWDLLIADETHFAARSQVHGKVMGYTSNPDEAILDATLKDIDYMAMQDPETNEMIKLVKPIKTKMQLHLSGTPYNIMMTDEFTNDNSEIIGRYSYTDMLNARDEWIEQHPNEPEWHSPYFGVPNLIRFGLNLTKECRDELKKVKKQGITDSFKLLFKVNTNKSGKLNFKNKPAIISLMQAIFGKPKRKTDKKLVGFLNRPEIQEGEVMKHLVICLPEVVMCHALKELLEKSIFVGNNPKRKVIVAVEKNNLLYNKEAKDTNALNEELSKCESRGEQTVTLTVDRFMTAVSIPLWDGMLYLKDTENSQVYDLNIFRICTRNVHKDVDKDGNVISMTNLKENVYLIDFKIERLFNLMADSVRNQAVIKKEKGLKAFELTVKDNVEKMPIYLDGLGDKLNQMKELNVKDFMQYYTNYNSEHSIEETIQLKPFDGWMDSNRLDSIINLFDESYANKAKKININLEGSEESEIDFSGLEDSIPNSSPSAGSQNTVYNDMDMDDSVVGELDLTQYGSTDDMHNGPGVLNKRDFSDKIKDKKKEIKKKKATTMLKCILYFAMCLDDCWTLEDMIKQCEENESIERMALDFGLTLDILYAIKHNSTFTELNEIDKEIYNTTILINDSSRSPLENIQVAINKMGQIAKSEVVTPSNLVDKMLDKLDGVDMKGKSILEVNSKYGEFVILVYKRFGKEAANNVKVVASSEMTKNFIRKMLNILGLDELNLVELDDYNGNGYYDIKDFIEAPNEEILEFNEGMKFDVILANPPYDNGLHEKFSIKYFDICDGEICWVSPLSFLLGKRQNKKLTVHLDKYRTDIEQINGNEYFDAAIGGTMGIVYVDMSDKYSHYVKFDGKEYNECSQLSNNTGNIYITDDIFISFKNKVKCDKLVDNLYEHLKTTKYAVHTYGKLEENPDINEYVVGIIRLHAPLKSNGSHGDSWTAMISKNKLDNYIGKYKDVINRTRKTKTGGTVPILQYYFPFKTKAEAYNFLNYIQTTFVQVCLSLIKNNANFIDSKEIAYVPWQDFTEEWTDEKLFKKYGITKEEIQHIYDILPNYYGIERINLDEYEL